MPLFLASWYILVVWPGAISSVLAPRAGGSVPCPGAHDISRLQCGPADGVGWSGNIAVVAGFGVWSALKIPKLKQRLLLSDQKDFQFVGEEELSFHLRWLRRAFSCLRSCYSLPAREVPHGSL